MSLRFEVRGTPVPQGSIRHLGKGRPAVHGNADRLLPWRSHVQLVAEEARGDRAPYAGPVEVGMSFYVARPKSTPKRVVYPGKRPDLSHLVRAVEDACTAAGVWLDDSQVVVLYAAKMFVGNGHLDTPGVAVRVAPLDPTEDYS